MICAFAEFNLNGIAARSGWRKPTGSTSESNGGVGGMAFYAVNSDSSFIFNRLKINIYHLNSTLSIMLIHHLPSC